MANQFAGWIKLLELAQTHKTKAALREAITKADIQILETEPLSGYYRAAAVKDGPLLPVAIWRDEYGKTQVLRGTDSVELARVWPYCAWNPVPYEWYELVAEKGGNWPDAAGLPIEADVPAADRAVERTDNKPPEESEIDAIARQIENAKDSAEKQYKEITSDEHAMQAQAARSRLNELAGTADKKREAEKRPHLDKCKEIDGKWQPWVKMAKAGADAIRDALRVWETKKFKAEQEALRQREEEARKAAEEAAAKGEPAPESPVEEEPVTPITTNGTIKGASGRAATVRTIKVAKVVDYDKAYAALKAIPEVKKVIDTVAQRLVNAGQNVPGVEVEEQRDVA